MSAAFVWAILALGIGAVVVRRESLASLLISAQTALVAIGVIALVPDDHDLLVAAIALALKAVAVAALLRLAVRRAGPGTTTEHAPPLARVAVTLGLVLASIPLVPPIGLEPEVAENGAVALVACGIALLVTRRAALFAVLALLVAENGIAVAAVSVPGGLPAVIELGIAVDVVLVLTVALAFHGQLLAALRADASSGGGGRR